MLKSAVPSEQVNKNHNGLKLNQISWYFKHIRVQVIEVLLYLSSFLLFLYLQRFMSPFSLNKKGGKIKTQYMNCILHQNVCQYLNVYSKIILLF